MGAPTFHGSAANPADNGAANEPTTLSVTPPGSMVTGDLVVAICFMRGITTGLMSVSATGGQTWNTLTEQTPGSNCTVQVFWCQYNGTWSTNPSFAFGSSAATIPTNVTLLVYRPSPVGTWSVDTAIQSASFTGGQNDISRAGQDPTATDPTVTIAGWISNTAVTYSDLQGTGWEQAGASAQYRNTAGSDQTGSFAHYLQTGGAATGNVSKDASGSTSGLTFIVTFKNVSTATTLSPSLFTNTSTVYAATITTGAVSLSATRFDGTAVIYTAIVGGGAVSLVASLFTNDLVVYSPTITNVDRSLGNLVDKFDSLDSAKWGTFGTTPPTVTGGKFAILCVNTYANGFYSQLGTYKLQDSYIFFEPGFTGGDNSQFLAFAVQQSGDSTYQLRWEIEDMTILRAKYIKASVETSVRADTTWSSVTHKYLKIRESGGTIYWDYSADGASWTNYTSVSVATAGVGIDPVVVVVGAGAWNGQTGYATIDNVNVWPPLLASIYNNVSVVYAATVSAAAQTLTPTRADNTNTVYTATVSTTWAITVPLISNSQTFYGPVVSGLQVLTASRADNTNVIYGPTVTYKKWLSAFNRRVQSFVPWYAVSESMTSLAATYGGNGPSNSLTHLAFQAWEPAPGGASVQYTTSGGAYDTASNVDTVRDWAHANGIKVLLCVHNEPTAVLWDWPLAKSAFDTNQAAFIASLVAAMNADNLDGIDIDFEGFDTDYPAYDFNADKTAFVSFLTNLKTAMGPTKFLSVNTVAYINHAVNMSWWADMLPIVDGLSSMGYNETGQNSVDWAAYAYQRDATGAYKHKFAMGLPAWLSTWQGNTAQEQVDWFLSDPYMGVSLWEAQFLGTAWQTSGVWSSIHAIKGSASYASNTSVAYGPAITTGAVSLSPSLFTNSLTNYAPTVTPGAVSLTPTLVTNGQTFYGLTITATYSLTPALVTNAQVHYGPTVSTLTTLSPTLVTNTNTAYAATITTGAVSVSPALYQNDQSFYAPTVTRGAVGLTPSLVTNVQVVYDSIVLATYLLQPSLVTNAQSFYAPTVTVGTTLTASLVTNDQTHYAPTISVGAVSLLPSLVTNDQVHYAPTVLRGAVTLTPSLYTNTQSVYAATVTAVYQLTPALAVNTPAHYGPTVTVGAVSLAPDLYSNPQVHYAPSVTVGAVTLAPAQAQNQGAVYAATVSTVLTLSVDRADNAQTFYAPTISALYTLTPDLYTNEQTVYEALVQTGGLYLLPATYSNTQTIYSAVISTGAVSLDVDRFDNENIIYAATIIAGAVSLTPAQFQNTPVFYAPVVSTLSVLTASLYTDGDTIYSAVVTVGVVTLEPSRVDNTSVFYDVTILAGGFLLQPLRADFIETIYSATVTTGAVTLEANLYSDPDTFYRLTISAVSVLTPTRVNNVSVTYEPTVTTANTLLASRVNNAQVVYGAVISSSTVLTAALFVNTPAIYVPEVDATNTLTVNRYDNASLIYTPEIDAGAATLAPALVSDPDTVFPAVVTAGAFSLTPDRVNNLSVIYAPVVTFENNLVPALFTNTSEVYQHFVDSGATFLLVPLVINQSNIYSVTVSLAPLIDSAVRTVAAFGESRIVAAPYTGSRMFQALHDDDAERTVAVQSEGGRTATLGPSSRKVDAIN